MIAKKDIMNLYHASEFDHMTLAGGDFTLPILGAGTIDVSTDIGPATLQGVFHAPNLRHNLMSVSRLDDKGLASIFSNGIHLFPKHLVEEFITKNITKRVLTGQRKDNLYQTELKLRNEISDSPTALFTGLSSRSLYNWHLTLNHMNYTSILQLAEVFFYAPKMPRSAFCLARVQKHLRGRCFKCFKRDNVGILGYWAGRMPRNPPTH
jgi:hypothetical protein